MFDSNSCTSTLSIEEGLFISFVFSDGMSLSNGRNVAYLFSIKVRLLVMLPEHRYYERCVGEPRVAYDILFVVKESVRFGCHRHCTLCSLVTRRSGESPLDKPKAFQIVNDSDS